MLIIVRVMVHGYNKKYSEVYISLIVLLCY